MNFALLFVISLQAFSPVSASLLEPGYVFPAEILPDPAVLKRAVEVVMNRYCSGMADLAEAKLAVGSVRDLERGARLMDANELEFREWVNNPHELIPAAMMAESMAMEVDDWLKLLRARVPAKEGLFAGWNFGCLQLEQHRFKAFGRPHLVRLRLWLDTQWEKMLRAFEERVAKETPDIAGDQLESLLIQVDYLASRVVPNTGTVEERVAGCKLRKHMIEKLRRIVNQIFLPKRLSF